MYSALRAATFVAPLLVLFSLVPVTAPAVVVDSIAPICPPPATGGVWCESGVTGAGQVGIVDLTGAGGNLESHQPLPTGAVRLGTGPSDSDKAEIRVDGTFGRVQDILPTLTVGYAYHKASVPGGNAFAAPAIKLSFFGNHTGTPMDNFVTLVYEPTWNQPGSAGTSVPVPTDAWTEVALDADTGLWWNTGGFGQPGSGGGPPLRTLEEWAGIFEDDFPGAQLVSLAIGVGTSNPGQVGYFDDVRLAHASAGSPLDLLFDFEPRRGVPEPTPFALLGVALAALSRCARRANRRAPPPPQPA